MKKIRMLFAQGSFRLIAAVIIVLILTACIQSKMPSKKPVQLITLDPGHFHAAVVQKSMYEDIDSTVYVYAPEGNDLKLHLDRINSYNSRLEAPTRWKEEVYAGNDFFEKMIAEKKARLPDLPTGQAGGQGNVVVISGNNQKKTDYILNSLK